MLKRSRPWASSSCVTGMGKVLASFGTFKLSSARLPRGTVPTTKGRADRPSSKNVLAVSGLYFGWSAICCRQPPSKHRATLRIRNTRPGGVLDLSRARIRSSSLMGHLENTARVQRFQKTLCGLAIEFRIGGFNAQEETVARSQSKSRHMENRVIGHGQTIQTEHPQRSEEHTSELQSLRHLVC